MTLFVFGSARHLSVFALLFVLPAVFAALAAAFVLLYGRLNDKASPDILIAPAAGKFWGLAGCLALGAFLWEACSLLIPGRMPGGLRYWPVECGPDDYLRHAVFLSSLGAASFWISAREGLSGNLDRWNNGPFRAAWPRLWLAGAISGAGAAAAGICAHRWIFIGYALRRADFSVLGTAAALSALALFPAFCAFFAWASLSDSWGGAAKAAFLLAVWGAPSRLTESYLRGAWDYGKPGLAAAAGVPEADKARLVEVVVLSARDGSPGIGTRDVRLAAAGADVSEPSLRRLRVYLEERAYRSVFAREGVDALRRGWALQWDMAQYLDAAALRWGNRIPADMPGFLAAIRIAPVTLENYRRLQQMAERAASVKLIRVDQTQRLYEGLSAAYAHFGEMKESNFWLDKIQGLWPLYSEDIHVEPVEQDLDCAVSGAIFFNGAPASDFKVGLFVAKSTASAITAEEGLVDSTYSDPSGAFRFANLAPGRYYLAVEMDPALLPGPRPLRSRNSPGVLRLSQAKAIKRLGIIELYGL